MGAEGIGQFLGMLLRARPQTNPVFLQQVNEGLVPKVNPYLEPTSQLKRVFGNNADDLNMAYAATTGRGLIESRDAMQRMQEANRLTQSRDEALARHRSQEAYDDYTLSLSRDKERDRIEQAKEARTYGTEAERERRRKLADEAAELNLREAKDTEPFTKRLREISLLRANRGEANESAFELFKQNNQALVEQDYLNQLDPLIPLGPGDARIGAATGRAIFGPMRVEIPGTVNQYGVQGKPTERWTMPPSVGPNPAIYTPGSLLRQNAGGTMEGLSNYSGAYLNPTLQSWLRAPTGSSLVGDSAPRTAPPVPITATGLSFVDQEAKNAQDQLYIDSILSAAAAERSRNELELNKLLPIFNRNVALSRGITLPGAAGYGESDPVKRASLLGRLGSQIDTLQRKLGTAYE